MVSLMQNTNNFIKAYFKSISNRPHGSMNPRLYFRNWQMRKFSYYHILWWKPTISHNILHTSTFPVHNLSLVYIFVYNHNEMHILVHHVYSQTEINILVYNHTEIDIFLYNHTKIHIFLFTEISV